jgi:DNA repair exonuclease SbcCD ATPase subunit
MKILRLFIKNFLCHDNSFIDFTQFNSALIVGKVDNNELYSNGVGKTAIFKAIEYVLFNQSDSNLERIIRDDCDSCNVIIDFVIDSIEYRLSRTRTKKGNSDLTLYQRTQNLGSDEDVYYKSYYSGSSEVSDAITNEKFWKDISGRRTADTEKDLSKLIKFNFKSFRNVIHFQQNAFDGLATATPAQRKTILKDVLDLAVYSKLEKIAKDECNAILKNIDKYKILLENLGDPEKSKVELCQSLSLLEEDVFNKKEQVLTLDKAINNNLITLNDLTNEHSLLESKFKNLLSSESLFSIEKTKLETSIKEYGSKISNIIKSGKELVAEIKKLKDIQTKLAELDYSKIEILSQEIVLQKEEIAKHNVIIEANSSKLEELNIPFPADNSCKHCRQQLSPEHKKNCKNQINEDIKICKKNIEASKLKINDIKPKIVDSQEIINNLIQSKQQIESVNLKISSKEKELQDKKGYHSDYKTILNKFNEEFIEKSALLDKIKLDLSKSSIKEDLIIKDKISSLNKEIQVLKNKQVLLKQELSAKDNNVAVTKHNIKIKEDEVVLLKDYNLKIKSLNEQYESYPIVISAFSSVGIPNLIIQNVLDDLQVEANNLLSQLRPGLQLSFFVEKTKSDGVEADTLDINYFINGKERYYEQISGAMKLAVAFSLKLGLSFLLQKMLGIDIKFLLLDEIDQPLDKASVDAFAEIIKFFQKDYTILVITHNDRLKDKFINGILVEQDINMVSRARVVSSW